MKSRVKITSEKMPARGWVTGMRNGVGGAVSSCIKEKDEKNNPARVNEMLKCMSLFFVAGGIFSDSQRFSIGLVATVTRGMVFVI